MAASAGTATDHEQILAAVVVALGKSSSKVAHYNSELDSPVEVETPKPSKMKNGHHHLFSCFSNSSLKTPVQAAANSKSNSNWPRSPAHMIMSRLLLSPDMSPDRIGIKSTGSSPGGGDQSPARSRFKSSKSHFSGPLLCMNSNKKSKSKKRSDEPSAFQNEREEPTSPKVTCMGTVKAPKKKSCSIKSDSKFCKPPTWKNCTLVQQQQQQQREFHSGLLDLSRFGDKSGELRVKSGELKQPCRRLGNGKAMHEQQQQQQQLQQRVDRKKSMRMLLREGDGEVVNGDQARVTSCDQGLKTIVACRSNSLKKADEICLWKRRCAAEPLRLQLVGRT